MVEMEINKIRIDDKRADQVIVLKEKNGNKFLPMVIGIIEANAIKMKLLEYTPPRPLTHDLFIDTLTRLGVCIKKIIIEKLDNNVFYAKLYVKNSEGRIEKIDSRPSDGIALALRSGASIYVAENVLEKAEYKSM